MYSMCCMYTFKYSVYKFAPTTTHYIHVVSNSKTSRNIREETARTNAAVRSTIQH